MYTFNKVLISISLILITCLTSSLATAQQSIILKRQMADDQRALSNLQNAQLKLKAEKKDIDIALDPLIKGDTPGKAQLDEANAALVKAEDTFKLNPTDENKAKLKNSEFKVALAERKFKKANTRLFELQQQSQTLQEKITANETSITEYTSSIEKQRAQIKKAESQELAQQQSRAANEQRLKDQSAQAEIARLKERLALEEKARMLAEEEARKAAVAVSSITTFPSNDTTVSAPSTVTSSVVNTVTAPVITQKATVVDQDATKTPTPTALPSTKNDVIPLKIEGENGITLLLNSDAVNAYESSINQTLEKYKQWSYSRRQRDLIINGALSIVKPLGKGVYYGTATVKSGNNIFAIARLNEWQQLVPKTVHDGMSFIFYINNTDKRNPKLVYYPKSLSTAPEK